MLLVIIILYMVRKFKKLRTFLRPEFMMRSFTSCHGRFCSRWATSSKCKMTTSIASETQRSLESMGRTFKMESVRGSSLWHYRGPTRSRSKFLRCYLFTLFTLWLVNFKYELSFKECYGSLNEEDVSRVKKTYEELKIPRVFRNYEEESYLDIRTHIDQVRLKL